MSARPLCGCRGSAGDHYAGAARGWVAVGADSRGTLARPAYRYACGPAAGAVMYSPGHAARFTPAPARIAASFAAERETYRGWVTTY